MSIVGGLLLGLLTTALSAGGLALQRSAHKRLLSQRVGADAPQRRSFTEPHWRWGVAMMIVSALLSLAVTALLGQALSSSLAALTIVWAFIFSVSCLHENHTRLDVVATAMLIAGTVLTVTGKLGFSPPTTIFLSADGITLIFKGRRQIVMGLLIGTALVASLAVEYILKKAQHTRPRKSAILAVRLFLASTFGATTGVCSKGFSVLVAFAITESTPVGLEIAAVFCIALIASVILQLRYLGEALKVANLNSVVPIYQSALVVGGAICGLTIWDEPIGVPAIFFAGVACILSGILLKVQKAPDEPAAATPPPHSLAPFEREQSAPLRRRNSAPAMLEVSAQSKALQEACPSMPISFSEANVGGGGAAMTASPLASSDAASSVGLAF